MAEKSANETSTDEPSDLEQVITCLGDDAATLRHADEYVEMADNMEAAARLLESCAAILAEDRAAEEMCNRWPWERTSAPSGAEPPTHIIDAAMNVARTEYGHGVTRSSIVAIWKALGKPWYALTEGYAVVPVEPTPEILMAIWQNERDSRRAWERALAASPASQPEAAPASANETGAEGADEPYQLTIDVRDLFAYLRAAWREGQHYDREDFPDQADSWSAASDYAIKTIERWTSMNPAMAAAAPADERATFNEAMANECPEFQRPTYTADDVYLNVRAVARSMWLAGISYARAAASPAASGSRICQLQWIGESRWLDVTRDEYIAALNSSQMDDMRFRVVYDAPQPAQAGAPAEARAIGEIHTSGNGYPFAVLSTAYDEHGNGWKDGTKIYAAPPTARVASLTNEQIAAIARQHATSFVDGDDAITDLFFEGDSYLEFARAIRNGAGQ
ncbi:hypothetical protein WL21_32655 [Burkholderia ubonensis]|nr:hypothetical protein WJ81_02605 [Burkholderia ubonensis]KVZ58445.1 hypothetical protein WL20_22260 [Burkholderia ubonensis]KVZ75160.1 hypothetical protein WL21_32655 [Burkholderia ubonensis]